MYILVDCIHTNSGKKVTKGYKDFKEVKEEVVNILNSRGWDNKNKVDLRNLESCLNYILSGTYEDIKYKESYSYVKYSMYKYGYKGLI